MFGKLPYPWVNNWKKRRLLQLIQDLAFRGSEVTAEGLACMAQTH